MSELDAKWLASEYLDDGRWGVLTSKNVIVIGVSVGLSRGYAEQIAEYHNQRHRQEPVEYPSSPQVTPESERMYVCLKCGAESWRVPSAKLTRCDRGECSGQIVANPRRG